MNYISTPVFIVWVAYSQSHPLSAFPLYYAMLNIILSSKQMKLTFLKFIHIY